MREHLAEVSPDILHTHLGYADLLGGAAARHLDIPAVSTIHVMEWSGGPREQLKLQLYGSGTTTVLSPGNHGLGDRAAQLPRPGLGSTGPRGGCPQRDRRWVPPGRRAGDSAGSSGSGRTRGARRHGDRPPHGKGPRGRRRSGFQRLTPEFPNLRLLVLGEGPDRGEVERALENLGARAIMTGHLEGRARRTRRRRRADPPDAGGCVPDRVAGVDGSKRARDRHERWWDPGDHHRR